MSNLLIEIGNTALKAAWTDGLTLGKTYRYQGEKKMDFILSITSKEKPLVMTVATVGTVTSEEKVILQSECSHLLILDSTNTDYLKRYGLPDHLSYDRAADIEAVKNMFKGKGCTVFDFGTTLTIDHIDADGEYRGGNVSPGCRMRFNALNRYSRNLPLLSNPSDFKMEGSSLETSVGSGVMMGMIFEIEGYLRLHPGNIAVFTGGDAIYFAKRMKNSIFVICNLSLIGLALITEDYVRTNIQ